MCMSPPHRTLDTRIDNRFQSKKEDGSYQDDFTFYILLLQVYDVKCPRPKDNCMQIVHILAISSKPRPLCSSSPLPSDESNFIFVTPILAELPYLPVIHSEAETHC